MPDAKTWRQALHDVAGLLSAYDATTLWIGEYSGEMISRNPEFAVADGIIELSREQHGSSDERFLRVVKLRGSGFLDGQHTFRITSDGLQVYPRLVSPKVPVGYSPIVERVTTGIGGLDSMIAEGWLRGTTTLVAGPSGAGKTILGLHFLREGVRKGEPSLLVNFQENPTQLARVITNLGWRPAELMAPGKLDLYYTSPVELQIDTIVREVFQRIAANGVRRVVVDAIGDLAGNARDAVRLRHYLYALTQHLALHNVTSMILLETEAAASWSTGHDISYMSDNAVLLGIDLGADMTRTIRVLKSRGSAHDARVRVLRIGGEGITIGEPQPPDRR
jgi:circadian clock protein KaiC